MRNTTAVSESGFLKITTDRWDRSRDRALADAAGPANT